MQLEKNIKFNESNEELTKIFDLYKLSVLEVQCFKDGIINTSFCLLILKLRNYF